jgi:CYTH domain-containing protein
MEIERKFLIRRRPSGLSRQPHELVRQGYLLIGPEGEVRVRRRGRKHLLTVKSRGGRQRLETEIAITARQFARLWPLTHGKRVEKTRYLIPYGKLVIELDVYHGPLRGLMTAEVEFASNQASDRFIPPPWFGKEVTEDSRYKNQSLARKGKPR